MKDMYKGKDFGGQRLGSGGFRPGGNGGNNGQFLSFLSTNNKSYSTPREMALRSRLYSDNAAEVRELNKKSRQSSVAMKMAARDHAVRVYGVSPPSCSRAYRDTKIR